MPYQNEGLMPLSSRECQSRRQEAGADSDVKLGGRGKKYVGPRGRFDADFTEYSSICHGKSELTDDGGDKWPCLLTSG